MIRKSAGNLLNLNLKSKNQKGFTLIELLVVIAIVALLASILLVNYNKTVKMARDNRRLADIKQIMTALDIYHQEYGHYPDIEYAEGYADCDTKLWDISSKGTFIKPLVDAKLLARYPIDPLNKGNCSGGIPSGNTYFYRRMNTSEWGCNEGKSFYILGIGWKGLETSEYYHQGPGFKCYKPSINGYWDFNGYGFDWYVGKFE